jgi:hypothetical protein
LFMSEHTLTNYTLHSSGYFDTLDEKLQAVMIQIAPFLLQPDKTK